jgi:hypothetical protein
MGLLTAPLWFKEFHDPASTSLCIVNPNGVELNSRGAIGRHRLLPLGVPWARWPEPTPSRDAVRRRALECIAFSSGTRMDKWKSHVKSQNISVCGVTIILDGARLRQRSLYASSLVFHGLIPTGLQSALRPCGYSAWYVSGPGARDNPESSADHSRGWPRHSLCSKKIQTCCHVGSYKVTRIHASA